MQRSAVVRCAHCLFLIPYFCTLHLTVHHVDIGEGMTEEHPEKKYGERNGGCRFQLHLEEDGVGRQIQNTV